MNTRLKSLLLVLPLAGFGAGFAVSSPAPQEPEVQKVGKVHEVLKNYEGKWSANMKSMLTGESAGSEVNKMVLGGLWSTTSFKGEFNGMPFEGTGLTGFDGKKKQHVTIWVDNMSPGFSVMHGEIDKESGNLVFITEEEVDPTTGETMTMKHVHQFVDKDHRNLIMMADTPGGEMEVMRIEYTRK